MNTDQTEGLWKKFTGKVKEVYGDLTDDEIAHYNGKKDQLFGAVQQKYGDAREVAEKKFAEFEKDSGYTYDEARIKKDSAA